MSGAEPAAASAAPAVDPVPTSPPDTAADPTDAPKGTLAKDDIRQVVRAHLNEVRDCYNVGLARDATLTGRVKYQFTIAPEGNVAVVALASSELPDWASSVEDCIAAAITAWTFPRPAGGGNVVVTYPFVLVPGEARWSAVAGQPPHTAVVGVRNQRNEPIEGAVVMLVVQTPLRRSELSGVTDAQGVAIFSGLPTVGTVYAVAEGVYTETGALHRSAMGVILHIEPAEKP